MLPPPPSVNRIDRLRREVERNALRARNGIRIVTGYAQPAVGATPKDIAWRSGRTQLWRYRNPKITLSPPLLLVYRLCWVFR